MAERSSGGTFNSGRSFSALYFFESPFCLGYWNQSLSVFITSVNKIGFNKIELMVENSTMRRQFLSCSSGIILL